jgi:hypothetical protein
VSEGRRRRDLAARAARRIALGAVLPALGWFAASGCPVLEYGPAPEYGPGPCDPSIDLPQACAGDQECFDTHGAGWYCDDQALFFDGCDHQVVPQCVEGAGDDDSAVND